MLLTQLPELQDKAFFWIAKRTGWLPKKKKKKVGMLRGPIRAQSYVIGESGQRVPGRIWDTWGGNFVREEERDHPLSPQVESWESD